VLPQLIATFVNRRRAVKGMMKTANVQEKMQARCSQLSDMVGVSAVGSSTSNNSRSS
jgi:hypothetical protein